MKELKEKYDKEEIIYEQSEEKIEIFSPFLEKFCKTEFFQKIFTIQIPGDAIEQFKLKMDFASAFNELNESNALYESITFYFNEQIYIQNLKYFDINFNQIKRLNIVQNNGNYFQNNLINNLLSNNQLKNNLVYLNLDMNEFNVIKVNIESFLNINNLKSLSNLKIHNFKFLKTFMLKLENLKYYI